VTGLSRKDKRADINPYCVIKCEGASVQTHVLKKTSAPEWNAAAVFYRKNPSKKPVIVQVYHHNAIGRDELLGTATINDVAETQGTILRIPLVGSHKSGDGASYVANDQQLTVELTTQMHLDAI
jgi:Ca2+-dependent lipid-binding protein